jgi:uncharacterized damage-inducible protein DinB
MSDTVMPEMETLNRALDEYRDVVAWKLDGISEEDARRPLVPSGTTLGGVVKHLAYVERWWFQAVLAQSNAEFPWTEEDPDADWRLHPDDTVAAIIAFYRAECEKSRAIVTALDGPDAIVPRPGGDTSVRSVLVHMLEETARHAGHMDILREQIDHSTGWGPPGAT